MYRIIVKGEGGTVAIPRKSASAAVERALELAKQGRAEITVLAPDGTSYSIDRLPDLLREGIKKPQSS